MPKVTIPSTGSEIKLTEDFTFELATQWGNKSFWKVYFGIDTDQYTSTYYCVWQVPVKLPKKTALIVKEVYIKGTFAEMILKIKSCPIKELNGEKLWILVGDVNRMKGVWNKKTFPLIDRNKLNDENLANCVLLSQIDNKPTVDEVKTFFWVQLQQQLNSQTVSPELKKEHKKVTKRIRNDKELRYDISQNYVKKVLLHALMETSKVMYEKYAKRQFSPPGSIAGES